VSNDAKGPYTPEQLAEKCYMLIHEYQTRMMMLRQEPDAEEILGLIASTIRTALTSQAARVRELEEALRKISEYDGEGQHYRDMVKAMEGIATAALTPKEAT